MCTTMAEVLAELGVARSTTADRTVQAQKLDYLELAVVLSRPTRAICNNLERKLGGKIVPGLTRREKAIALFKPNESGVSNWVAVEHFEPAGLKWSKNGAARHGAYWGIDDIVWEKKTGRANAISHLRMNGWKTDESWKQTITSAVKRHFETEELCSLSLLRVPTKLREIDHRFGNKTHPDYIEMYKPENQKPADFQLIFSVLNSAKRQVCKVCCETGIRPQHPTLGFVEGDNTHAKSFPCAGCYLAEPERYRAIE